MKFCKLGIYTRFIEKLCTVFEQLMDRHDFEEFQEKL